MSKRIRVLVSGAAGRMGREVVRAVCESNDLELTAAVDRTHIDEDAGSVAGITALGLPIKADLDSAIAESGADVMVDFTVHESAVSNLESAIRSGVASVVGTTGFNAQDLSLISELCRTCGTPALIAPNFAIGAVLMMKFAEMAAEHLPNVEIIELHHDAKLDSPSGTAMLTAEKIAAARSANPSAPPENSVEKLPHARGAITDGIRIHSVRLPGYVAHQEVIFGGMGQTLTIRHDSIDRRSFMPGVLLAVRRVRGLKGLTVGLDALL